MAFKKSFVSIAAAAAVMAVLTGCGDDDSSSSTSTSSLTGQVQKADLNGSTVSFNGATAVSGSDGNYTITGATAATGRVTTTGGNYGDATNGYVDNNLSLLVDYNGSADSAIATPFSTMVSRFKDANSSATLGQIVSKVATALNVPTTAIFGSIDSQYEDESFVAVSVGEMMEGNSSLATELVGPSLTPTTLATTAAAKMPGTQATMLTNIVSLVQAGGITNPAYQLGKLFSDKNTSVKTAADLATVYAPAQISNVVNLQGNIFTPASLTSVPTVNEFNTTSGSTMYYSTSTGFTGIALEDQNASDSNASLVTIATTGFDTNGTSIYFNLQANGTVTDVSTQGNSGLAVKVSRTDKNTEYTITMTDVNTTKETDGNFTFENPYDSSYTAVYVRATGNDSTKSAVNFEMNATQKAYLFGTLDVLNTTTSTSNVNDLNVSALINYVGALLATNYSAATYGNFTTDFSGTISDESINMKLYLDVEGNDMTLNNRYKKFNKGQFQYNSSGYKTWYKVLDRNLTK